VSGAFALILFSLVALGCTCGKDFNLGNLGKSESNSSNSASNSDTASETAPSEDVVEGLVKETTSKFADAVDSGDFSDLHSYASQDFQTTYTVDQIGEAFKSYTDKKSVVVPILRKADDSKAEFPKPPSIRTEKGLKILVASGKFPTKPYNVRFDYEYVMRGGEWKLLKLVVNIP
jgi:hypothetical protein